MRPPRNRSGAAGFTLLEVLVAFVIAALALGMMFDGVLSGMRAAAVAAHTEAALTLARSRLAETLVAVQSGSITAFSDQEGDEGAGYHWRVQVRPGAGVPMPRPDAAQAAEAGADAAATSGAAPRAVLYGVTVSESWKMDGGNREVRLDGAKLTLRGGTS